MKIRSITYFFAPSWPLNERQLDAAGDLMTKARTAFQDAGFIVQTSRLATTPFATWLHPLNVDTLLHGASQLEAAAGARGFEYVSFGPAFPHAPHHLALIPEVLAATQNVFFSGMMTSVAGLHTGAVRACAEVIHRLASLTPAGFANLRFAALANVPAGTPFFPAAYHENERPAFALALESADLAIQAFRSAADLNDARRKLVESLENHANELNSIAARLAQEGEVTWGGLDFSLAPFPADDQSLGAAMEQLGIPALGLHGSLAAAAFTADALDRARYPRAGFNGLMLPVLEDAVLARRAAEGSLDLMALLLYSTVCGLGLDTIPLAGDTSIEALYALLLDVAAIALRLNKPLTARLMPIPGKNAGDPTNFDFAYFANSRVMALHASPLKGLLRGDQAFPLTARKCDHGGVPRD